MALKLRHVASATLLALVGWTPPASAGVPDISQSFFVPQAVLDSIGVVEGDEATPYFRACPDNDGDTDSTSLPNNARIKVVLRDINGNPVPDVSAADICILFNGGTAAQGFSGIGADSVIANSLYNQAPRCPDLRCVTADAPSDENGVAYITFTGPGGVRDPDRKWGHYDTELPVFMLGYKLQGRLTSGSANGTYTLRIKNFDTTGGLGTALNQGEAVTILDYNAVAANIGVSNALTYWRDFDGNGEVDVADVNLVAYHVNHDCDSPHNP
jgi:hypothetical protein